MRKAYQYRYIRDNDYHPTQEDVARGDADVALSPATLVSGNVFASKTPIYQLGIQALPGTKFYLNESSDPIIIGATGIYELDLHEKSVISALHFDPESIQTIKKSLTTGNGFLIVDIVYEEGEE